MKSETLSVSDPLSILPTDEQARALALRTDTDTLMLEAAGLRDQGFGSVITYSKKVFIPLTHLCRDVCHYCTFAQTPKHIPQPYMAVDDILSTIKAAEKLGCKEALFTLGEKPELRYSAARKALEGMGFETTIDYLAFVAGKVREETSVLPHVNPGTLTLEELQKLRQVSPSMGLMIESTSERLCGKGQPHYGSPDKVPARRLETLALAGKAKIPFTTGILIGIGETRLERIDSLLAIRAIHAEYGHIQEIIIQNFRAKPGTLMAQAPEPDLQELLWTIAVARLIFGASMAIQVPPNLSPGVLPQLVDAGINDWGGVSPLTPDYVNPEAPWPELTRLAAETRIAGKHLAERLTVYPSYVRQAEKWLDENLRFAVMKQVDGEGFPKEDNWEPGVSHTLPGWFGDTLLPTPSEDLLALLDAHAPGQRLSEDAIVRLFQARGGDFQAILAYADNLRQQQVGNAVSYVVNRNINYTNVCYFDCKFCAFSKGKMHEHLRGKPYQISLSELKRRVVEAHERGATEVTLQGGIAPTYDGNTYLQICEAVKEAVPSMHIHGFTPLEVWHGAATLNLTLEEYLKALKAAGLGTIPGTAAEILSDDVRAILCSDKINTAQWLEVMRVAHQLGIQSTATIMFGHIEGYEHWARHLIRIRDLQAETSGFTELVPLPFVARESPVYAKGQSRSGPSFRESLLMQAVSRIVLSGFIENIQASWVKLGREGAKAALCAGSNDLGGTLMNETITRSAGASHGQELTLDDMEAIINSLDKSPVLRDTKYHPLPEARKHRARNVFDLATPLNEPPVKSNTTKRLIRPGVSLDPRYYR